MSHDNTVPDAPEVLHSVTLTTGELRQVERALELTALVGDSIDVSDATLIGICALRSRFLDALKETKTA